MVELPRPPTPICAIFTLSFAPFQLEQEVSIVGAIITPPEAISDFLMKDLREDFGVFMEIGFSEVKLCK